MAACLLLSTGGAGNAAGANMITGGLTSQPIGHYEFCRAYPSECSIRSADAGPSRLTTRLWKRINTVNASVNRAVEPMNDFDIYGKDEVWTYPGAMGDCELVVNATSGSGALPALEQAGADHLAGKVVLDWN